MDYPVVFDSGCPLFLPPFFFLFLSRITTRVGHYMHYYRLVSDLKAQGRWFLGQPEHRSGVEVNPGIFTRGVPVEIAKPLYVPIKHPGRPLDFTFAAFEIPVVTPGLAATIAAMSPQAVQRIPVRVEAQNQEYEILNVTTTVACLDERKSYVERWTERDGWSDKVGQYKLILDLTVDPERARPHHIFRLGGWRVSLIVSHDLKDILEREAATGVAFIPASPNAERASEADCRGAVN